MLREVGRAAASLLGRATALLGPEEPRRPELLLTLAKARHENGELEPAYALLAEVMASDDADAAADAFFFETYARAHGESTSPYEMVRVVEAKLAEIESTASDRVLAAGYLTLGWAHFWAGKTAATVEAGERALEHAVRAGARDTQLKALRVVAGAMVHGYTPWRDVERHGKRMEDEGLRPGMMYVTMAAMRGDLAEARLLHAAWRQNLLEQGRLMEALGQGSRVAHFEYLLGDYERAERPLREAWDGLGEIGERGIRSTIGAELGDVLARLGRLDEAEAILAEAEAISTPDDWVTISQVRIGRAYLASARGEHDRAVELARAAVDLADAHEYVSQSEKAWLAAGEVLLAAGRREEARAALARVRELAERKGSLLVVQRVDALLAEGTPTP
jgi:tetratricopeptide (TPR) repeat protein